MPPGLSDKAVLEIDLDDTTGVFELTKEISDNAEINRSYLIGDRGQYIREAYDIGSNLIDDGIIESTDFDRREGYHADGGAGDQVHSLSFETGYGNNQWGDGSSNPDDPDDITLYDATGCPPLAQKQILEHYLSQARIDSSGQARLYWGQWTDGTHAAEAGVFDQPMYVTIPEASPSWEGGDSTSSMEGSLQVKRVALFPDVDVVGAAENALEELGELISDF
ncbi:hypothetical protein [Natronobacterium gregoryi]|uniref:Uncharacterized protein n=2 Tax=Natronobacterium gregoryi TaxID=44930 RepID=L0AM83_NATGS|nr:hypothetical protein [Natronobacterium gregoryi]AFZ74569.1 hypothetical protein Natgr_3450 [Natronobacterium gregoryi SP2]ELY72362.1 hypothetical protein C490_03423 [Natronobacterium gregoryi SP2]PLK21690.1 hypothetical protein CYV19_02315 [Natronobacterium gregoryi SP2]SFI95988.1 hypothetical protein SAMN05443661_110136 [Natronobacterium gregoryi]